jgi:hypothetical protein
LTFLIRMNVVVMIKERYESCKNNLSLFSRKHTMNSVLYVRMRECCESSENILCEDGFQTTHSLGLLSSVYKTP